jgi:metallophosphoesterase superfamily enzyme
MLSMPPGALIRITTGDIKHEFADNKFEAKESWQYLFETLSISALKAIQALLVSKEYSV